jgi:hypothetical protein
MYGAKGREHRAQRKKYQRVKTLILPNRVSDDYEFYISVMKLSKASLTPDVYQYYEFHISVMKLSKASLTPDVYQYYEFHISVM